MDLDRLHQFIALTERMALTAEELIDSIDPDVLGVLGTDLEDVIAEYRAFVAGAETACDAEEEVLP